MQVVESPVLGTSVIYRDMHRDIVNPNAPQVDFSADRTVASVGDTVVFTNNTTPPLAQWAWTITPASFSYVNGTKASSKSPAVIFNQTGQYSVNLSATNPLGSASSDKPNYITVNTKTGIALTSQPGVSGTIIYPNPTKDFVFVSSGSLANGALLQWHIYDVTGKNIANGSTKYIEGTKIDVTNCPAGLYYLQLNGSIWEKIVIEK
jgi:PKD repeat protein